MHYILFYEADPDYAARRAPFRDEHLALVRQAHERGEIVLAGPLADPTDGAVLVFRGESPEAAEAFVRADPYVTNGVIASWKVRKWATVVGS